ncbi:type III secretion system export apparatus subunit SctU [Endozoicomonadaceae bacterium StTr2]
MSGEKTEEPTPKKLRDARKKGQVAKSKEVSGTVGMVAVLGLLWAMSDTYMNAIKEMLLLPPSVYNEEFLEALELVVEGILEQALTLILPLVVVAMFSAIIGNVMQFGFLIAFESIKPDIKKISPVAGVKKIFAIKNLVEFFKSILKIALLSVVVYYVIHGSIGDLINLPHCGSSCILPVVGVLMKKLLMYAMIAFVIIAIADFMFEKQQFTKQNKMSKDEVKREHKESEGNQEIKGKRKQIHQEMINSTDDVKKSDVVIKNPTRIAIGLHYKKGKTPLPIVMAKGTNTNAKYILAIAKKYDIPVMENVPLARNLMAHAELASYIPADLIEPVAEVFRWVQELKDQNTPED